VTVQPALVDICPTTPGFADALSQDPKEPELLDITMSEGKGKENARESETGLDLVGKISPRKVWLYDACFTMSC
jgi:hypothetical protein